MPILSNPTTYVSNNICEDLFYFCSIAKIVDLHLNVPGD